jgi:hypothetical protein
MIRILALTAALFLAACGSTGDIRTEFLKAEAGYTVLLQSAANYVALPRCEAPSAPKICSKQEIVDRIRPAANSADATIQAAEDAVMANPDGDAAGLAIDAATNATMALQVILTQYGVR